MRTLPRSNAPGSVRKGLIGLGMLRELCLIIGITTLLAIAVTHIPSSNPPSSEFQAPGTATHPVCSLALSSSEHELWLIHRNYGLSRRDLLTGHEETVLRQPGQLSDAVVLADDQHSLCAVASYSGDLEIWRDGVIEWAGTLTEDSDWMQSVAIAKDGQTVFALSDHGVLYVIRRTGGRPEITRFFPGAGVGLLRVSPDGRRLAWRHGASVTVWDCEQLRVHATWTTSHASCTEVTWSPCSCKLATVGSGGRLDVWDVENPMILWSADVDVFDAMAVAFTADGRSIVTGGHDRRIRMWDAVSGRCVAEIPTGERKVRAISCSGDGRTVHAADLQGAVFSLPLPL